MKKLIQQLFFISSAVVLLASCKKDQATDTFQGGTAPAISASVSGSIPLSYANAANEAVKLSWTNPAYQFSSGPNSQDVAYLIEIDTTGANFTNPNRQQVTVSKDLSLSVTQGAFNDYLLNQLQLTTGTSHNVEIRVTASVNSVKATNLVSNVLKFTVTPYAIPPKVPIPPGALYLVGSATAGAWSNPVPTPGQQFTKVSATVYQITIALTGGQEYLFLPVNGDWTHKYAVKDKTVTGLSDGGDFGMDLKDNFPGPAASGTYKIVADFQRGKFTVTKQ